jgi:hypothetical protein
MLIKSTQKNTPTAILPTSQLVGFPSSQRNTTKTVTPQASRPAFQLAAIVAAVLFSITGSLAQAQTASATDNTRAATLRDGLTAAREGQTTEALETLRYLVETAPSAEEAARSRIPLANIHLRRGEKDSAREAFFEVASQPAGAVPEELRAEAALRLSLLSTGKTRAVWAERIVEGEIAAAPAIRSEAMNVAAAEAQKRGDLARAVVVLEASPSLAPGSRKRSHVLKELAGLEFERAKGEGNLPVPSEQRPALWERSRDYARAVLALGDAARVGAVRL